MKRFALPALLLALAALLGCSDAGDTSVENSSHDLQDEDDGDGEGDGDGGDGADDSGCGSSQECAPGEYCAFNDGECGGAPGLCKQLGSNCPDVVDPVCGCDGVSYDNGCLAGVAGVSVAHGGACPGSSTGEPPPDPEPVPGCGGAECGAGQYCQWMDGTCGEAGGGGGICEIIGGPCTGKYELVCGCDGQTYDSKCEPKMVGVAIRHMGPC
jgi:hypothetical protein